MPVERKYDDDWLKKYTKMEANSVRPLGSQAYFGRGGERRYGKVLSSTSFMGFTKCPLSI